MTTPLWLLGVDGVINMLADRPEDTEDTAWWQSQCVQTTVTKPDGDGQTRTYPVLAAKPVIAFIRRVTEGSAARIVWHSSWGDTAATHLAPRLDIPTLPVADAPELAEFLRAECRHAWWKLGAADRLVAQGRPLLWTDSGIAIRHDMAELQAIGQRNDTLLISPNPLSGLTSGHLEQISSFLGVDTGGGT